MQFTDRDKKIITFVARHKFATALQVSRYFNISIKATYRRLKKLVDAKYLKHSRIFLQKPGVYYPTRKGLDAANSNISMLKNILLATYHHDLQVTDLAIYFYEKGYKIITEKELISEIKKEIGQTGRQERVPDIVISKNGEKIAIELEIAPKSPARLKAIINHYARQRKYDQVWFYCQKQSVRQKIELYARKADHIKVFAHKRE